MNFCLKIFFIFQRLQNHFHYIIVIIAFLILSNDPLLTHNYNNYFYFLHTIKIIISNKDYVNQALIMDRDNKKKINKIRLQIIFI